MVIITEGGFWAEALLVQENSTTIENVLYVEGLKHSLLSISQLCDKGYKVNFGSKGCTISSNSSSKVLFTGKRVNTYIC